eukprot:CAMPEP_0198235402 /NCGR_PEP_ID=MMETSP1446-20131203/1294_1 /TAXON_ID=1461542 ORGANISM="Unidentified sp, Strain CCMP2111" /NCGR_SAMPLE_ID=MMETSP1446 /ASSEMBLY_ACC=CAM_ASM_001112 /LENGTH=987 /DNA_ID=CAMNT_0043916551 /DNA_START=93 /DNA_END=3056 /DNA_ORIENTATION=-
MEMLGTGTGRGKGKRMLCKLSGQTLGGMYGDALDASQLPCEVLLRIFEFLIESEFENTVYHLEEETPESLPGWVRCAKDIASCAMVCQSWRAATRAGEVWRRICFLQQTFSLSERYRHYIGATSITDKTGRNILGLRRQAFGISQSFLDVDGNCVDRKWERRILADPVELMMRNEDSVPRPQKGQSDLDVHTLNGRDWFKECRKRVICRKKLIKVLREDITLPGNTENALSQLEEHPQLYKQLSLDLFQRVRKKDSLARQDTSGRHGGPFSSRLASCPPSFRPRYCQDSSPFRPAGHSSGQHDEAAKALKVRVGDEFWSAKAIWGLSRIVAMKRMREVIEEDEQYWRNKRERENIAENSAAAAAAVPVAGPSGQATTPVMDEERRYMEEWTRLCVHERNVEEGALAIASVFNWHLDELNIPRYLDQLAEELSFRLDLICPPPDGINLVCRRRDYMTNRDQAEAVNSLLFNPRPTEEWQEEWLPRTTGQVSNGTQYADRTATTRERRTMDDVRVHQHSSHSLSSMNADDYSTECDTTRMPGLGLKGNITDYYNPQNSFLDHVLGLNSEHSVEGDGFETFQCTSGMGIPISLAVVYAAVGRRAGVPVRMIKLPGHFLVAIGDAYVDVFNGGQIQSQEEAFRRTYSSPNFRNMSRSQIHQCLDQSSCMTTINMRLCDNLINSFADLKDYKRLLPMLSLVVAMGSFKSNYLLMYAHVWASLDSYDKATEVLNQVIETGSTSMSSQIQKYLQERCTPFAEKFRKAKELYLEGWFPQKEMRRKTAYPHVKYRIGEVMQHGRYGYRGVIYGWDPICRADEAWVKEMGVAQMSRGRKQPFYRVLVDCMDRFNQVTYVAEDNIAEFSAADHKHTPPLRLQDAQMSDGGSADADSMDADEEDQVQDVPMGTEMPDVGMVYGAFIHSWTGVGGGSAGIAVSTGDTLEHQIDTSTTASAAMVTHPLVGRFFETYSPRGWHTRAQLYKPNAIMMRTYPED